LVHQGARLLLGMLVVSGFTIPMLAQFTTAQLSGTVLDPSGLAVVGASVTVRDKLTGYTRTTKTGISGEYLFPTLPVGNYQVTVTKTGFASYTQQGVALQVGKSVTLPVRLRLGAETQHVTVTANASMVTTNSATVGQLIDQRDLASLPLLGRHPEELVFLTAGATNATPLYCAVNCEGAVFPTEQYAKVNGSGANGVSYELDGADYNDIYLNTNMPFPSPDALQEFNVVTGNMSAAYGNAIGGVVNAVLKSGTNSIHGDAYEFVWNYALDARDYFASSVNPLHQNQFGGTIGGPILRNRLFYFGSYQGTRFSTANNGEISFVPNAAERTGDFSDLLPGTQLTNPSTGVPYLNNQIPVNPVAAYILRHVPLPNMPSDEFIFNGFQNVENTNEFLGKLDYIFGKSHLSGHYLQLDYTQPLLIPPASNILLLTSVSEHLNDKSGSLIDLYTISPSFLLGSYFGFARFDGTTAGPTLFTMPQAGVDMAVPPPNSAGQEISPGVNVGGYFGFGSSNLGIWNRSDLTFREIATLIKDKNEIKFGGQAIRFYEPIGNEFQEGGIFDFSNSLSGNDLADFELGDMSTFIQGGGLYLNVAGTYWSAFAQDDWRATPRLTLSAGLRWDPWLPPTDSLNRFACFAPGAAQSMRYPNAPHDLIFAGDPGCPETAGIHSHLPDLAPRLGFADQLTKDGKTSIRGGIGYYYEPPNTLIYQQIVGVPPYAPVITLNDVSLSDPYGSAGIADPFPAEFGPRNPGPSATFPSDIGFSQIESQHLRPPVVLAWNLTLERSIGTSWLLRASYVGNAGHFLYGTGDQESGLLQLNPAIYIPGVGPNGQPLSTVANEQQRRVYPAYGSIAEIDSGVNSNYNAGEFTVEKRFTHGFSVLSNFTWAKGLDDFAPDSQFIPFFTNSCSCGRYFDYGPSDTDLTDVFKIDGNYEIPHVAFHGLAGKLINGWGLSAISQWHTGFPFPIMSGVDNSLSGMEEDRADLTVPNIGDAVLSSGRSHAKLTNEWFNVDAFAVNKVGTFGNTGKNILRGPRYFDADLAVTRNIKMNERLSFEFRAEFYNAFNNVNFGMPGNVVTNSSTFGQITGLGGSSSFNGPTSYGTAQPREIQFGLKAIF
jgi:hypothetical protein